MGCEDGVGDIEEVQGNPNAAVEPVVVPELANYRPRDGPHTWRSLYCTASLLIQTLTSSAGRARELHVGHGYLEMTITNHNHHAITSLGYLSGHYLLSLVVMSGHSPHMWEPE